MEDERLQPGLVIEVQPDVDASLDALASEPAGGPRHGLRQLLAGEGALDAGRRGGGQDRLPALPGRELDELRHGARRRILRQRQQAQFVSPLTGR